MDNHPIPQDVTGFQFRLIGNMTVKQFAYVASGVVSAVIIWYLPLHVLLKGPLLLITAGGGALLAFIPIEGRPMDLMAGNFFKALFAPNQFLYHKTGGTLSFVHLATQKSPLQSNHDTQAITQGKQDKLTNYLQQIQKGSDSALDQKESDYLQKLFTVQGAVLPTPIPPLVQSAQQPAPTPAPQPSEVMVSRSVPLSNQPLPESIPVAHVTLPQPSETASTPPGPIKIEPALIKPEIQPVSQPLSSPVQQIAIAPQPAPIPVQPVQITTPVATIPTAETTQSTPSISVEDVLAQKQQLEDELAKLKQQLKESSQPAPIAPQAPAPTPIQQAAPNPQNETPKPGITLPGIPNLLQGNIRDSRGNVLPNILVEVRDLEDNPVRAFKTNQLGRFASATALLNGSYTVSFEDPKSQHTFAEVKIEADGNIIPSLDVVSIDAREELRKSLFA